MFIIKPLEKNNSLAQILKCIETELLLSGKEKAQLHIGNIIFDQYICCESVEHFQSLFHEIYFEGHLIGFLILEDESYYVYLNRKWDAHRVEVMQFVEQHYFSKGTQVTTTENLSETYNLAALQSNGYIKADYYRYNGIIHLPTLAYDIHMPEHYRLRRAVRSDIEKIVQLIGYATKVDVSLKSYLDMQNDPESSNIDEWVITTTDDLAVSYVAFWKNYASKTVLIEPVACMEAHRKKGLTKCLLLSGLLHLREAGFETAYVSTSGSNMASQALYTSVGFKHYGWEYEFTKQL